MDLFFIQFCSFSSLDWSMVKCWTALGYNDTEYNTGPTKKTHQEQWKSWSYTYAQAEQTEKEEKKHVSENKPVSQLETQENVANTDHIWTIRERKWH